MFLIFGEWLPRLSEGSGCSGVGSFFNKMITANSITIGQFLEGNKMAP